jgi:hypothetical protein
MALAYDHMMLCGRTYENVSRMAECNLANGACETARKYVTLLSRTLFHRGFARRCERLLADAKAREEYFAPVRAQMPTLELPLTVMNFAIPLNLVESRPDNRLAFDYLIAWCLLESQALPMMPHYLGHLKGAGYTGLPIHVQEALLSYARWTQHAVEIPGFKYDPETRARFSAFLEAIGRNSRGGGAPPELGPSLAGTFMYYSTFLQPHDTPSYGDGFWRMGNELQALGMDAVALIHYRCAALLSPQDARTFVSLADLLKKQGKLEEADAVYAMARKISQSPARPSSKPSQGGAPERVE